MKGFNYHEKTRGKAKLPSRRVTRQKCLPLPVKLIVF